MWSRLSHCKMTPEQSDALLAFSSDSQAPMYAFCAEALLFSQLIQVALYYSTLGTDEYIYLLNDVDLVNEKLENHRHCSKSFQNF